jgi:DNA-directed RNA polymerase subunit RPC12/RpoP
MLNAHGQRQTAWLPEWLTDAQEVCPFCYHVYILEMEYRCIDCDAAICPFCMVEIRESSEIRCPHCPPPEEY